MNIQSLIERPGGTHVTMGNASYHFKPREANGPHLATVNDRKHIARFLAIPEGYCIPEGDEEEEEITDDAVALSEPSQDVDSTKTTEPVIDPVEALQSILNSREADSREDAEAAFAHVFGRAPNHNAKTTTIVKKIIEHAVSEGLIAAADDTTEAADDTTEAETVEPVEANDAAGEAEVSDAD